MFEIKALILVLLFPFIVMNWCCPVFAEHENFGDSSHVELMPLYASYDTNSSNDANSRLNLISLRRIIPIIFESSINSKSVCIGDQIKARLKEDLYYGRKLIARQNSILKGCVISYRGARTLSNAIFDKEDRLTSSSAIGIQFSELVIDNGKSITLSGLPVHQESVWQSADGYAHGISVDHQGRIVEAGRTLSKDQKDSYNVLRVVTNAPVPGGLLLNVVAAPVVMGAVGSANPDLAFGKPLDHDTKYKRLKGMAYGFVTNLPGAFFVQAVVQKGDEVILNSGDELMIDLTINSFRNGQSTGINQVSAPGAALAVNGQILDTQPVRLLPASLNPYGSNSAELALKSFIPSSD